MQRWILCAIVLLGGGISADSLPGQAVETVWLDTLDLWRQKALGIFEERFAAEVPSHGVVLVRFFPVR